ncbi:aminoacyl-tRNA hydrolase [Arenibacter sp. M-2]|uniref:aminoacyl-tRNA hydrolase n=1 Tax=Arenibacter sp. M-2 TaxID=3053612 RepID=UPI002570B51A|nr:aminoacyl-tRNA hydrolase [Arenibacter sp. M-2]MDL5511316.1 aminoacyl-tRNA hydrolase [Arenibacter sp. M-2]|tara:strand:+ start:2149 stop:2778 length:630 start_codon:yes stop_codon:yes gene_type:complete
MFQFLNWFFKLKGAWLDEKDGMKKFLVVGLGNIGEEYADTRHNIGFKILDSLSVEEDFTFETVKLGDVGTFKVKGRSILCLKPSTYMNRSGKAVKYWMDKEKIPLENVLIITDDINLSFGTIRLKTKGSDGGHNGLKDVQHYLLTTNYNRLRFGVGSDFGKGKQIDYVLGEWSQEEKDALNERYERVNALIRSFVLSGVNRTMNEYNGT